MELVKFQEITQQILENHTDQAKVSLLLKELSEDYPTVLKEAEVSKETASTLTEANEKLRSANMELFLSLGGKKQPSPSDPKPADPKPEETPITVNDLLDDKGNLK